MALFTPKKVPVTWYKFDVSFSIELLRAYVDGVESQVRQSIEDYKTGKQVVADESSTTVDAGTVVGVYRGLDDGTWDLAGIFEDHFPSLQRQSALITLFSFLEHELDSLCGLFHNERGSKVELSDLKGKGVDRATIYLERVVGFGIDKSGKPWTEIKSAQKIRNLIVHSAAKLAYKDGNIREAEKRYVNASPYLSGDEEVHIEEGYLSHVLDTFNEFFKQLNHAIQRDYA